MIKKIITILLLLGIVVFTGGCNSYTAYKDYYTNPNDYSKIWTLAGFYWGYEEISPLFPKQLDNLEVADFMCRYDQQLPLGEGVQLLLSIAYEDPTSFEREVDRIASLTTDRNDSFNDSLLDAYAVRICEELVSEYALVDSSNQMIYYIYLRNIPVNEIEINHELLPHGYTGYGEFN